MNLTIDRLTETRFSSKSDLKSGALEDELVKLIASEIILMIAT